MIKKGTVNLDNTFVIRTDDVKFEEALSQFLLNHCHTKDVNATYFKVNNEGAKKVMETVFDN